MSAILALVCTALFSHWLEMNFWVRPWDGAMCLNWDSCRRKKRIMLQHMVQIKSLIPNSSSVTLADALNFVIFMFLYTWCCCCRWRTLQGRVELQLWKNLFYTLLSSSAHNKIHPYCLAFAYRALWVSLSLVCTTERVNLRLQRTGLCNRFTSLSPLHRGGNSAGMWASGADQGPVKHSICVPSQRISSAPQPCNQPAPTQMTIWRGFSSLPKHCKVNTSGIGGRI